MKTENHTVILDHKAEKKAKIQLKQTFYSSQQIINISKNQWSDHFYIGRVDIDFY